MASPCVISVLVGILPCPPFSARESKSRDSGTRPLTDLTASVRTMEHRPYGFITEPARRCGVRARPVAGYYPTRESRIWHWTQRLGPSDLWAVPSVLSRKFIDKVCRLAGGRSVAPSGAKIVAQGVSPGEETLTPPSAPLSRAGGRGDGGEGGFPYPRLAPWATFFRPSADGLNSSTNF